MLTLIYTIHRPTFFLLFLDLNEELYIYLLIILERVRDEELKSKK
jgi:hypothetical protein